ncbi:C-type natriuretic peptide [Pogoniulus pusillus]|uniref:C-type natriuretic peptide n=1 Tax=Pogoniulus pusillus TaxID=488313 RepID=UPI0030B93B0F
MNEAESPSSVARHFAGGRRGPRGSALNFGSRQCRPLPGAPLGSALPSRSPLARFRRMQISPLLAGGLLLALLSVGLEAKPVSQLPQKASRGSAAAGPPEAAAAEREKEREKERSSSSGSSGSSGGGSGGSGPREAREARAEARARAGWARLLQDPPGRRHKGLHKKGLGKGCFGLKLDRIGAMSGLGC